MSHFWWVRHGPTHEKAFVGWRDVPADLSDIALLRRVDAYLPKDALVVSSDLSRSITTADAIQGNRERLTHEAAFREFDFGDWDGMTFDAVAKRDPELSRTYWEQPGDLCPPNGESWNGVAARVNPAVDSLVAQYPERHIVVVAHFGVILTQVQKLTGGDAYKAMGQTIDNLSITDLRFIDGNWHRGQINHLP